MPPPSENLAIPVQPTKLYHGRLPTGTKLTQRRDGREWPLCGTWAEWHRMTAHEQLQFELVGALPFLPEGSIALTEVFPDVRDPAEETAIEQPQPIDLGPLADREAREGQPDGSFCLAVTESGDLVSRKGRPLYATRAEWAPLLGQLKIERMVSATVGRPGQTRSLIFGAEPLSHDGRVDPLAILLDLLGELKVHDGEDGPELYRETEPVKRAVTDEERNPAVGYHTMPHKGCSLR